MATEVTVQLRGITKNNQPINLAQELAKIIPQEIDRPVPDNHHCFFERYSEKDSIGGKRVYVTTNHKPFRVQAVHTEEYQEYRGHPVSELAEERQVQAPRIHRCFWCLGDFEHEGLGIPIAMKREEGPDSNGPMYVPTRGRYIFSMVDLNTYCCYECEYGAIKKRLLRHWHFSEPEYEKSLQLLKIMFSLQYPGEKLEEAIDPRLLVHHGGPLRVGESTTHCYIPTTNIVTVPCKREYKRAPEKKESTVLHC